MIRFLIQNFLKHSKKRNNFSRTLSCRWGCHPYGHPNYALEPLHLHSMKSSFASRLYRKAVMKKTPTAVLFRFGNNKG